MNTNYRLIRNDGFIEYYYYLKILEKDIHSVVLAINDEHAHPATAFMDVMLTDKNGIYFITSRGKDIYARMNNNKYAALSGMVGNDFFNSKMISVRGKIRNIGNVRVMELFEANPYMYKIYPTENGREVIDVFQIIIYILMLIFSYINFLVLKSSLN